MKAYLLAVMMAAVASPSLSQQCSEPEQARLRELDKAWAEATRRGDRAQLETIFADDFASTDINGSQDKATTIDAAVRAAERTRASGQTAPPTVYDNYVISCTPVSAVITHRATTTATVNGKEQPSYFRSVHVLEKRGGRWRVVGNAGHALTDAGALLYLENDWNEARIRKDIPWFERILTDDLTAASASTGTFQTKSEYLESIRADKSVIESIELLEPNVRVDGNTAIITGINRTRGRDAQGKPFDRRALFTGTWVKRDGRWMVRAFQGTVIP
ncbi:MAG TPA: nuclear transport factor 2 family protein [Gemmatimonadaceae bacterium]|nr:nuclear transport factor 2 family protein [Gemmatimonadaceae bacterium]